MYKQIIPNCRSVSFTTGIGNNHENNEKRCHNEKRGPELYLPVKMNEIHELFDLHKWRILYVIQRGVEKFFIIPYN